MKTDGQLPVDTKVRSSKYLNNLIEQDHRGVKLRIGPMLGFKWFTTAAIVIAGVELLRQIHKSQFNLGRLRLLSGTQRWKRNKIRIIGAHADPQFKLHQSLLKDLTQ